jgi:xylan 1,4-beta-xylosidase
MMKRVALAASAFLAAAIGLGLAGAAGSNPPAPPPRPGVIDVVLTGDYPDPTIVRAGEYYYMTHTSHTYVPGLLVWRSKDLLNWERVGYALRRSMGDVWAPDLAEFGGRYFIYFPARNSNWVVTASSPEGPWSEPVDLHISGIDPGHVAAPDGRRYLYQDSGYVVPLSADGLSVTGERRRVYEGWAYPEDWTVECFCLEGPKLMFFGGFYYLTSAEGGTAGPGTSHMAVLARSKNVLGPWENDPANPLVHTYCATERFLSKGHGTVFRDAGGAWCIVYHAYEKGYRAQGRQTLLEPLELTRDKWFRTVRDPRTEGPVRMHRNVIVGPDDFSGDRIKLQWQFSGLEAPAEEVELSGGALTMPCLPDEIRVLHAIPGDHNFEAAVRLEPESGVEAGLILHYDQKTFAGIGIKDGYIFTMAKGELTGAPMIEAKEARYFKIRLFEYDLTMLYSDDGLHWMTYPDSLNVLGYEQNMLGGFLSLKVGIYGRGEGRVRVDDFAYRALGDKCPD